MATNLVSLVMQFLTPDMVGRIDKVLAIPGVAEVLKPSVDTLKAKLTGLAA